MLHFKYIYERVNVFKESSLRFVEFKFAFCRIQVCVSYNSSLLLVESNLRFVEFKFASKESSLRFVEFKFASKESSLRFV